jgi:hypothetical protein
MTFLTSEERERIFTPTEQEQSMLVLQDKCPHNQGWRHIGHGHNDDCYECVQCGKMKWW